MKHFKILSIALLITASSFASGGPAYSSPGEEITVLKASASYAEPFVLSAVTTLPEITITVANEHFALKNFSQAEKELLQVPEPVTADVAKAPDINRSFRKPDQYNLKRAHAIKAYISRLLYLRTHNTPEHRRLPRLIRFTPERQNC